MKAAIAKHDDVFVFVDNSNLWIEGKKAAGRRQKPPVEENKQYRVEYGKLLAHIAAGRSFRDIPRLYGSEPPPNDSVWKMIQSKGFDVQVFKRNFFGREKALDMQIGMDVARLIYKSKMLPSVIALVAGDGDYVPVVESAQQMGWEVELWYWSNAASTLKKAADKFESLDKDMYRIGFDEKPKGLR